jgi:fructoselysine-6-phosphate deglycase
VLGIDKDEYISGLIGAVGNIDAIQDAADEIYAKGIENIFFVGSGGTVALQYPLKHLCDCESVVTTYLNTAGEIVLMNPKNLHNRSLAVFVSDSGTTAETVAAARYAKERGATSVSFVSKPESPLGEVTDYTFANISVGLYESFQIQLYAFVFRFLEHEHGFLGYSHLKSQAARLPGALFSAKVETDYKAEEFARRYKDEDYHMLVGAGNMWGEAYLYAMCILEEMQWIRTKSVHAAEFFHGSLELVDENTSVILLKGEDHGRGLVERVEQFAKKYTQKLTVFDTLDFPLNGIGQELRAFLSPIAMVAALERVSKHLEQQRNHPLSIRRYYKVVPY